MTHIEHCVIIPAPLDKVFPYVSDYRTWPDWFEGVSEFTPTTAITLGNGARYAYRVRMMGVRVRVETEIINFAMNRGWTGVSAKGVNARTYWNFDSMGDETKFAYALEYQMPLPLLGSLIDSLFIKPQWHKIIAHSLHNLKQHFAEPSIHTPG